MNPFKIGWIVAFWLAVLTVVEYIVAVNMHDTLVPMIVLALPEAALIVWFFMHIPRLWRKEAH